MRWKWTESCVSLAVVSMFLSGCDTVVPSSYQGESRLNLVVTVLNNTSANAEFVVPALAHVDETRVEFRPVKYRPDFKDFRLDVFDAPSDEWRAPVDRFLAPDVIVAREYIGAVIESRLDVPIVLSPVSTPVAPHCWSGACDVLPGAMTMPCAEDDQACSERQRQCPNGMCQVIPDAPVLPEGAQDVTGFAPDYVLVYAPKAVAAGSWAALKLGAPNGLEPGYHLSKRIEYDPSSEEHAQAGECHDEAFAAGFARFNDEHGTTYDLLTLSCLDGTQLLFDCDEVELPKGSAASALAAALTDEEVERGCLELAPELELVRDPEQEPISVLINGTPPDWLPPVPPALPPIVGQEDVTCAGADAERPAPAVRMTGHTGSLCPEDSLQFIEGDGAFSILHDAEEAGVQSCELEFVVTVPAGYRFRKPRFAVQGFAWRETERVPETRITMTYAMASEPKSSQHPVLGTLDGDFFTLVDTPDFTVPECNADCEAVDLDLKIAIDMDTPSGAQTSLDILEGEFEIGVEWTTCSLGFPER